MPHLPVLCARAALLALVVFIPARFALAAPAEIVMLQGKGERSDGPQRGAWVPAAQSDKVEGGY